MKKGKVKRFIKDERGVNTVEIVIIIAVVVGIALIFRDKMTSFAVSVLNNVLKTEIEISPETIREEGIR